jgi:hypothetical protein
MQINKEGDMIVLSFILTEICNWSCEYCAFPQIKNNSETTITILRKHLGYIKEIRQILEKNGIRTLVEIQGGEVGLIDENTLKYFFSELGYPVCVSTNGKFMENSYHKMDGMREYINEILWHICQSPNDFKIEMVYDDPDIFINKGIVHYDIKQIGKFIRRNPHITINYVELEYDIHKKRSIHRDEYSSLYNEIKDAPNITTYAKERIFKRISESTKTPNKCRDYHLGIVFDMVNETICRCQRCPECSIPLTKENTIRRLTTAPKFIFEGSCSGCDSCTRLFYDKYNTKGIEQAIRNRRIFR